MVGASEESCQKSSLSILKFIAPVKAMFDSVPGSVPYVDFERDRIPHERRSQNRPSVFLKCDEP